MTTGVAHDFSGIFTSLLDFSIFFPNLTVLVHLYCKWASHWSWLHLNWGIQLTPTDELTTTSHLCVLIWPREKTPITQKFIQRWMEWADQQQRALSHNEVCVKYICKMQPSLKHLLPYDHWRLAMFCPVSTWIGDFCSSFIWVLPLTFEVG